MKRAGPRVGEDDLDPLGLLRGQAVRRGLCDFCGDRLGRAWLRFEARNFSRLQHGPRGQVLVHFLAYWAACALCWPLVERRAWRELLDRVMPAHERRSGPLPTSARSVLRAEVAATYLQLEQHLTGEVTAGGSGGVA